MAYSRASKRVREVYRLVTDVCQLGHDAQAWTNRLMQGLVELFDARFIGLAWTTLPDSLGEFNRVEMELHHGLTEEEQRLWTQAYCGPNPGFQSEFLRRVINIPSRFVTVRRQDVMSDEDWYALPEVRSLHRQLNVDANLASFFVSLSMGRLFGIGVQRAWDKPQFTVDERRELRLLHLELARAWRDRIDDSSDRDEVIRSLPERARQVLWLLCLGRSEKQIADSLNLSQHTVHNHVKRLHQQLAVNSRGELLARVFHLRGGGRTVTLPPSELNQFRPL
jgi:DNA-binding CsgD family transcriptional regulator